MRSQTSTQPSLRLHEHISYSANLYLMQCLTNDSKDGSNGMSLSIVSKEEYNCTSFTLKFGADVELLLRKSARRGKSLVYLTQARLGLSCQAQPTIIAAWYRQLEQANVTILALHCAHLCSTETIHVIPQHPLDHRPFEKTNVLMSSH